MTSKKSLSCWMFLRAEADMERACLSIYRLIIAMIIVSTGLAGCKTSAPQQLSPADDFWAAIGSCDHIIVQDFIDDIGESRGEAVARLVRKTQGALPDRIAIKLRQFGFSLARRESQEAIGAVTISGTIQEVHPGSAAHRTIMAQVFMIEAAMESAGVLRAELHVSKTVVGEGSSTPKTIEGKWSIIDVNMSARDWDSSVELAAESVAGLIKQSCVPLRDGSIK